MAKCTGRTLLGKKCKRVAMGGRKRCAVHTTAKKSVKKSVKKKVAKGRKLTRRAKPKLSKAARLKRLFGALEKKLNKSGGVDKKIFKKGKRVKVARKAAVKKAWLTLARKKRITLKPAVKAKFKAAVKRAGY